MGLKSLRLEKGWSQEQLATISGLSERTIQRAERGDMPSLESLRALAASFELSHAELRQRIETDMETPDMPANDTLAPNTPTATPASEPTSPVLNTTAKRLLLGGAIYVLVISWMALMQAFAGWDPELLPYVALTGGGLLATYAFANLGGFSDSDKTDDDTSK